jgi:hypothetical protein
MSERFTETVRAASEPGWSHAVGHRFVKELLTGTVAATWRRIMEAVIELENKMPSDPVH